MLQMPGSKKGQKRGLWDIAALKQAVRDVTMYGKSKKSVAKQYCIPRETLSRHLRKVAVGQGVEKVFGRKTILNSEQENELSAYLQLMEESLFGLTPANVRRIVFMYCEENGIQNNFSREKKTAGRMWFQKFMRRHPELSIRAPEPVSIQRAMGFNEPKVNIYLDLLHKTLFTEAGERKLSPGNIYNVDETGISICHKPHKVIAQKGKKSVGALKSAERGKNTTVVCCFSATGHYVPPFIIFPRARMKQSLMDRAPPGSVGVAHKSGWINEQLFAQWFDHFLAVVQPQSRPEPVLLLADGHSSHTQNLELIRKARENNVVIIIFPSHCTHKLQPCDVSFFKSLKWHYDDRAAVWLVNHPGRAINEEEMVGILNEAYGKAATVPIAVSGFRKSGIHPFDRSAFQGQFAAAAVTDAADSEPTVAVSQAVAGDQQIDIQTNAEDQQTAVEAVVDGQQPAVNSQSVSIEPSAVEKDHAAANTRSTVDDSRVVVSDQQTATETVVENQQTAIEAVVDGQLSAVNSQSVSTEPSAIEKDHSATNIRSTVDDSRAVVSDQQTATDTVVEDRQSIVNSLSFEVVGERSVSEEIHNSKTFTSILPIPRSNVRKSRSGRKVGHAEVITSSPYKRSLEQASATSATKPAKSAKRAKLQNVIGTTSEGSGKSGETKRAGRPKSKAKPQDQTKTDTTPCMYCDIAYCDSDVPWLRCRVCKGWSCGACVTISRRRWFCCSSCA